METLQVALGRRSYPIYIGGGLLEHSHGGAVGLPEYGIIHHVKCSTFPPSWA